MVSLESAWRREEGMGSEGQVVAWLDYSEERGVKCVRGREEETGVREELTSFTFWVK